MISVDYEQVVYNGNGSQTAWPYSFPIYDGDVVRLILLDADGTETDITQDYFVDVPGSTVYYPGYAPGAEPPLEDQPPKVQTGQKLIVYRDTEITQDSDLGDSWPFNVIEKGLDKLTMILQEKAFALARCLKISQGQAAEIDDYDTTVPLEADKVICGNAAGNGFEAREAMMEVDGAWDCEGRQIHSAADPTADQDAATKNYVDDELDTAIENLQLLADVVVDSGELQHITDQFNAIDANAAAAATKATAAANSATAAANSAAIALRSENTSVSTAEALTTFLETKETLTAPAVDPTLSISGAAADAAVVGTFKEVGNNLFDLYSVIIGKNQLGSSISSRAISPTIYTGNGCTLRVYNLPANLKFFISYYDESESWTAKSSTDWRSANTTYNIDTTHPYIRVVFASVDNNALTLADFVGLQIMLNKGSILPYEPYFTAVDRVARNEITNINAFLNLSDIRGLFPYGGWENGTLIYGVETNSSIRIRSDFVRVDSGAVLQVVNNTTDYLIACTEYDQSKAFVHDQNPGYGMEFWNLYDSTKYVRFVIKKVVGGVERQITPSEAAGIDIKIIVPQGTTADYLNVMTYNIGGFDYGRGWGIPSEIYDEKLINYRRFFGLQDCDVIGIQEYNYVDDDRTVTPTSAIFDHFYGYNQGVMGYTYLFSRYGINSAGNGTLTTSGRKYSYAYINVNGKEVYLLDVHLNPLDAAERLLEADDVLALVAGKERFVVFGDFNPNPNEEDTLYKKFTDAGYQVANCGWFGKYWTWSSNSGDFTSDAPPTGTVYYIDNIITNMNIEYVERLNVYADLSSDHIPIKARIKL